MLVRPIAVGVGIVLSAVFLLLKQDMLSRVKALSILALLLGNIVAILPWELWVYSKTNQIVMISSTGRSALRGGLVFGVELRNFRQGINLPDDVEKLMSDLSLRKDEMSSIQAIAKILIDEARIRPFAVAKLAGLKLVRSWYATDSNRFESLILLIQIPYLLVILLGTWCAWKQDDRTRQLTICVWMITFFFWGMTFMVVPLLRYMVPVMGLLFLLVPPLFLKVKENSRDYLVWRQ
jgi:hypothetical protein